MFGSAQHSGRHSDPEPGSGLRKIWGKFLLRLGFVPVRASRAAHAKENGAAGGGHHRTIISMPRDFIRRRRVRRRISNVIVIPLLSVLAAYVITRPTGGTPFAAPKYATAFSESAARPADAPSGIPARAAGQPEVPEAARANAVKPDGYKLADGPFPVHQVGDTVLHDGARNKDLHLRIFYPEGPGPFPIIVFSHGAGGSQNCCDALTHHWASYGYVTLQPTHEDSASQRKNSGEQDDNFLRAVRDALKKPELWGSRPKDVSFLLNSLPALQERIPGLVGRLDTAHIGVGGHSMGAFTADAIAGALVDLPNHPGTSFADSRVKAALLLSPQGPGEFGLTEHSWDQVAVPLLSMTGSLDSGANRQGPAWKKIPFERSEPGDKYHVFISGANHMSFVSARTLMPARAAQGEMILAYVNSASLAFWDAYLKADLAAKRYLQSDALPRFSNGAVDLSRR